MLQTIKTEEVRLTSGIFKERYDLNREYLMSLKNQGLLQNFYLEAGVILPGLQVLPDPDTDELHWGWDAPTCQLRGHFLGHWLSAAASVYATEKDNELKAKLDSIIDELYRCQVQNGGQWAGPIPEKYFEKLEKEQNIWSPQYVMHKLILGLTHSYIFEGNEKAMQILDGLSDWYINWTDAMLIRNPRAIYKGEESGMLEVWAKLYEITKIEKYSVLADRYSNPKIFRDLKEDKDALSNCHTNASIPWSHGAAQMYKNTGNEMWKDLVQKFWKCAVNDRGYYCTGGQSAGEYWTPPRRMGHYLGDRNQEFCTVYNMVRTAAFLYEWTKDTVYADYIELNLYNGFLAQQNQYTGMPTYFLPLKAGSNKKWGTRLRDFWCCHGTMVQAQTLYPSLIYYYEEDRIYVSQYIPSEMKTIIHNTDVLIQQSVNMKYYNDTAFFDERDDSQMSRWSLKFTIKAQKSERFTVSFRIPMWVRSAPAVSINNEVLDIAVTKENYVNIDRVWENDEVLLYLPAQLEIQSLEDTPDTSAVMEGPIVLAGLCDGKSGLKLHNRQLNKTLIPQYEHTYEVYPWKQGSYRTTGQTENFYMKPLYDVTEEEYTVYFETK